MQATTNDTRYVPGVEMIAELHTLRQKNAALEKENALLRELWVHALWNAADWERKAREEVCRGVRMVAEANRRANAANRHAASDRPGGYAEYHRIQPRRRGWVRGWL